MKQFPLKKMLGVMLATGLLTSSVVAYAVPSIALKVTAPKSSAGELTSKYTKGVAWTPCLSTAVAAGTGYPYLNKNLGLSQTLDALQFELNIKNEGVDKDATKLGNMAYDTYFYLVNNKTGAIYNAEQSFAGGQALVAYTNATIGTALPLRAAEDYTSTDKKIILFGSAIRVDVGIEQGLWSAVGVMIQANIPLSDFTKWEAFAVMPVVLGTPIPSTLLCDPAAPTP